MNEKEEVDSLEELHHEAVNKINGAIKLKSHGFVVPDVSLLVCNKKESFGNSNLIFEQIWITRLITRLLNNNSDRGDLHCV